MQANLGNRIGLDKKDAATIKKFDKDIEDQDKLITNYNKEISEFQKTISSRDRIDNLRGGIDTAIDHAFSLSAPNRVDLETFLNSDSQFSAMQTDFQELFGAGGRLQHDDVARQDALNRINEKKAELTDDYKQQREAFARSEFVKYQENLQRTGESGFIPNQVNSEIQRALENYNNYATSNNLNDMIISSYGDGGAHSYEQTKRVNDLEKDSIQGKIDEKNRLIRSAETNKVSIENQKKAFKENPEVKNRELIKQEIGPSGWKQDEEGRRINE